jgi:hypothetical protein
MNDAGSHFDQAKAEAFAGTLLTALNHGALCLMVSVGRVQGRVGPKEPIIKPHDSFK